MWEVDYYAALEVAEDASGEEIRAAYRRLAKAHHPDRNPNHPNAGARFRLVAAAYSMLSDADTRAHYDASRALWGAAPPPPPPPPPPTPEPEPRGEALCCFDMGRVRVAVTRDGVQVGSEWMAADSIVGLRYGVFHEHVLFVPVGRAYAAWVTDGTRVLRLECSRAAGVGYVSRREAEARHARLVGALRATVAARLAAQMVAAMDEGRGFVVGPLFCDGYGLHRFGRRGGVLGSAWRAVMGGGALCASHLAWDDLRSFKAAGDRVVLIERSGRPWARLSAREDWNACCLPALLRALSQR